MRSASPRLVAVPIIALSLILAACGGNTVTVQEVPGDPVNLSVPGSAEALAPEPTPTPTATAAATETPAPGTAQATPTPAAGTTQTTPQADTGGGTEAPAGEDAATTDQPPPAGSDAEKFEDFCAENPGAC